METQTQTTARVPVHWKKLQNPEYIGAYSLDPGEERIVEIIKVETKQVKGPDGKAEECIVAHLKNEKPMILNATNCKTIAKIYDTPYVDNWAGKKIIIYAAKVKAFGEVVEALRIKSTVPALPELTPTHEKWNDAAKALKEGKTTMDAILKRFHVNETNRSLLQNPAE